MQNKGMAVCSLAAALCMLLLHFVGARSLHRAISFELAEANPLAWLLVVALVAAIGILVRKMWRKGYVLRTVLLAMVIPALALVGFSSPMSDLHLGAFVFVCLQTWAWCAISALDHENTLLVALSAMMIVVPVIFILSPGLGERTLIAYALACCNLIYYVHLDETTPIPWKSHENHNAKATPPAAGSRPDWFPEWDTNPFPRCPAPAPAAPRLWNEPDAD